MRLSDTTTNRRDFNKESTRHVSSSALAPVQLGEHFLNEEYEHVSVQRESFGSIVLTRLGESAACRDSLDTGIEGTTAHNTMMRMSMADAACKLQFLCSRFCCWLLWRKSERLIKRLYHPRCNYWKR